MSNTKTKDKYALAAELTPLVWPMIRDQASVGDPIPGNNASAGVHIFYKQHNVWLTTEQYETFRTEVLIPIQDTYFQRPNILVRLDPRIEKIIYDLIINVFDDA